MPWWDELNYREHDSVLVYSCKKDIYLNKNFIRSIRNLLRDGCIAPDHETTPRFLKTVVTDKIGMINPNRAFAKFITLSQTTP